MLRAQLLPFESELHAILHPFVTLQERHLEGSLVFVWTGIARYSGLWVLNTGGTPSTGLKAGYKKH